MQVAYMESSYFCQPPHCCVVGKFGPDRHRLVASICSGSTVAVSPPVLPTILHIPPQPLRCMKTEPAHTWQAGVGQDHPLLRFCDLDIFKLMNFEAKVLHENDIRSRLGKSPLNLKQHLRTPTWRLPVALRLGDARCFSELRMQVAYMESSYLCQPPHCCVEQVESLGRQTQTSCLDLLRIHSCCVTSSTASFSPPLPSLTTTEPQHGDCSCIKTQQCAMFLRTENA